MLNNTITINDTVVGSHHSPYVIAEAGSNFNQDLETARQLINVAADAGANAVKFQLFRADLLYPDGGELYDIFKSIELSSEWVPLLADHAKQRNIDFMASAFDTASLDILEGVDVPAHKIASSETTNLAFVQHVASTGKPVIISTGMCDMVDVEEAVNVCLGTGNTQIALMQCGTMYPLPPELANLKVISSFSQLFNCPTGFSDHTLGQTSAITAVGLGATIYEKHFTLDRQSEGPDHFYALEPEELKSYISALHEAHQSLGNAIKEMLPDERKSGRREGLYLARDMQAGEIITASDIIKKRPAIGLRARYYSVVTGATLTQPVKADEAVRWDILSFSKK